MLLFAPLAGAVAGAAAAIGAMVIRMMVTVVMAIIRNAIEQVLQEILEEVTGNEDLFDELGLDPFWRHHNWWIQDEVEQMAEEGASPEEVIAFAEQQSQFVAASLMKTWVAEPGGSLTGTCRYCNDLDGTTVNIRDHFALTTYGPISTPPRHPNCKCRISISF